MLRHPALRIARVRTSPSWLLAENPAGKPATRTHRWEVEEDIAPNTARVGSRRELEALGPEVHDFLEEGTRRWSEQFSDLVGPLPSPGASLLFPNLVHGGNSLLTGLTLLQVQPRHPAECEVSARHLLPGSTPAVLRQAALDHACQGGAHPLDLDLGIAGNGMDPEGASRAYYRQWARMMAAE
jgi:hypothetical protein